MSRCSGVGSEVRPGWLTFREHRRVVKPAMVGFVETEAGKRHAAFPEAAPSSTVASHLVSGVEEGSAYLDPEAMPMVGLGGVWVVPEVQEEPVGWGWRAAGKRMLVAGPLQAGSESPPVAWVPRTVDWGLMRTCLGEALDSAEARELGLGAWDRERGWGLVWVMWDLERGWDLGGEPALVARDWEAGGEPALVARDWEAGGEPALVARDWEAGGEPALVAWELEKGADLVMMAWDLEQAGGLGLGACTLEPEGFMGLGARVLELVLGAWDLEPGHELALGACTLEPGGN
ncbi:unnamed protein product [Closterium sp. Naga37s-1]|nr:unnamed protein product [Closterium sp. Naga37s-1]